MEMPIMTISTAKNITVEYSDTVLSLKDLGSNLKIIKVSDVKENMLQLCLDIIVKSNLNVTFNNVQYSKQNKAVYLYTDKEISIKNWKNLNSEFFGRMADSETLEEIKKVFVSEHNYYSNFVSLFDVSKVLRNKRDKYDELENYYIGICNDIVGYEYNRRTYIIISSFGADGLNIIFHHLNQSINILFDKKDQDLYVKKDELGYGKDLLSLIGDELSELYDKMIEFSDFQKQSFSVRLNDSKFSACISIYGVDVYAMSKQDLFKYVFKLSSSSENNSYEYNCNSLNIINAIKGHEDEFFKRLYIDIEDCPKWMHKELYELRNSQIEQQKIIEAKRFKKENRKQKRLELTKKIFPFVK